MKYQCVADCRYEFPVTLMCRLLRIKASGYYAWSRRPPSRRSQENGRLRKKIVEIHAESYASGDFQALLTEHGIECSMSGAGNCYDNAVVESWFGLLKRDRVHRRHYRTRQEARQDVFDYIERFYNRRSPHGSAGRMAPLKYEESTLNQPVH